MYLFFVGAILRNINKLRQLIRNEEVGGSNPLSGINKINRLDEQRRDMDRLKIRNVTL
jgi:hypothetical protein